MTSDRAMDPREVNIESERNALRAREDVYQARVAELTAQVMTAEAERDRLKALVTELDKRLQLQGSLLGLATTEDLFRELEVRLRVGMTFNGKVYTEEEMAKALAVFRRRLPWYLLNYRTVEESRDQG